MKQNFSLGVYKILLVTLITSLTITGISYIDDKIWNIIMLVIGMIAYSIVGFLFSLGLLDGKQVGKEAYAAVFILLILFGYGVYCGIKQLQQWVYSWSLPIKIIVPIVLGVLIVGTIIVIIKIKCKSNSLEQK